MKNKLLLAVCLLCATSLHAQEFDRYFADRTLRVDYLFSGDANHQEVSLDKLSSQPTWAGRRHKLTELPLLGNGIITMRDAASGAVIYRNSFSSLYQEWLQTDEAKQLRKSFENSFLLPFPLQPAEVEVTLLNYRHETIATLKHTVRPDDILIRQLANHKVTPHRYIVRSGAPKDCIDIAILAEGYRADEAGVFYQDAERAAAAIFSYSPFKENRDKFNIVAVASVSDDSGVSIPLKNEWKDTAFGSHYSTFYQDRYLTSSRVNTIHDALAGIDYEHILILVNSEAYGGGGIYNSYTMSTAHHPTFVEVVVHEFGHAFGGLADEYFYPGDTMEDVYPLDIEPWEPNITTLVDFGAKWQDMLKAGTPVPTPVADKDKYTVGVYEGGGYSTKGVYRPVDECRMRNNTYPTFCPVCQRALLRMIEFYTK
jgi:hypothetical protein